MSHAAPILVANKLGKAFDGLKLFEAVDFSLQQGTVNSLFGKNGSGKTTFFNLLSGLLPPDTGEVLFREKPVRGKQPFEVVQMGLARMWQQPRLFGHLDVLENLALGKMKHPGESLLRTLLLSRRVQRSETAIRQAALVLLRRLSLEKFADRRVSALSPGEAKMVNLAMLIMTDADLLLLDEPFSGIPPATVARMSRHLRDLADSGKTILMIEHKQEAARAVSDHVFEIENRQILPRK